MIRIESWCRQLFKLSFREKWKMFSNPFAVLYFDFFLIYQDLIRDSWLYWTIIKVQNLLFSLFILGPGQKLFKILFRLIIFPKIKGCMNEFSIILVHELCYILKFIDISFPVNLLNYFVSYWFSNMFSREHVGGTHDLYFLESRFYIKILL